MPVLRLFAAAREAAGTASDEVPGLTVDEVLDAARARYGSRFAAVAASSRVWRNGQPAAGDDPVGPADEVAVLPPVSGGSGPMRSDDGGSPERPARRSIFPDVTPSVGAPAVRPRRPARPDAGPAPARARGRDAEEGPPARGRAPRAGSSPASGRGGRTRTPDGASPAPAVGRGRARDVPAPARARPAVRRDAAFWDRPAAPPPAADSAPAAPPARPAPDREAAAPASSADGASRREPARPESGRTAPPAPLPSAADVRPRPVRPDPNRPAPPRRTRARRSAAPPAPGRPTRDPDRTVATAAATGRRPVPRPVPEPAPSSPRTRRSSAAPAGAPVPGDPTAPAVEDETAPPTAGRLTRLRSVNVPVTGHVRVWGKQRQVSGARRPRSRFARRYAVVYDTDGPKVTLGILWFVAVIGALVLGWAPLTLLYGVAAGWAAMEVARRAAEQGRPADVWVAALGAAVVAASAAAGSDALGVAIVLLVVVAVAVAALGSDETARPIAAAGATVLCALPFGLAGASVILSHDLEIGAVVVLVLFVSAYEMGDFLIGSGSSNSIEGPLTGIVTIAVVALVVTVLQIPPFDGAPALTFAALAAVACPLGQFVVSALLPAADAEAPAARRLDSLVLLAPMWALASGIFIDSLT